MAWSTRGRGAEGLGLGVLSGDWGVGGATTSVAVSPAPPVWVLGVGGEADVGVATATAWTWLGAKLLGDGRWSPKIMSFLKRGCQVPVASG